MKPATTVDGTATPRAAGVGHVLGDRYRLSTRIAMGGMGEVWAASDEVLERQVAVKVVREDLCGSRSFLDRFRTEARHAASLNHPGVARVYDYGEDRRGGLQIAYLVMELVPGEPLTHVLARSGRLPTAQAVRLLVQVADALQAAHEIGLVHRDVKPGNLIVMPGGRVKITDFGIARAADHVPITEAGHVLGTARYMSPEQASCGEAAPTSDVYSLAIVGYELLVGHPPFTGPSAAVALAQIQSAPPPLPADVPPGIRDAIMRGLAKDPSRRPPNAGAFAAALRGADAASRPHGQAAQDAAGAADAGAAHVGSTPTRPMATRRLPSPAVRPVLAATELIAAAPAPLLDAHRLTAERRSRRHLLVVAVVVVAVLLALAGLRDSAATSATGSLGSARSADAGSITATSTTPAASATTVAASIFVDPATLIGLPRAQAQERLQRAGLIVAMADAPSTADRAGFVVGVQPAGPLPPGATVTLAVGAGATTSSATATTAATAVGKGKGKPKGAGKGHG